MRRLFGRLSIILLLFVLVIPACTSAAPAPDKPSAAAATAPAAAKPAQEPSKSTGAKPPIKIGYLAPLTGFSAQQGTDMRDGFLLYLDQKGGMLAGRKVELIVEDDEMNPQTGMTKAKKLVERDGVQMLAGVVASAVAYSLYDYVVAQKIPLFINNAGADDLTQTRFSPYIFRNSFSNSQQMHPLGEWAYKKGYRKISLVSNDNAAGYESAGAFARTFTDAGGKIIQEQYTPSNAPDPAPVIAAINTDADAVFAFIIGTDALRFVPAYDQYGLKKRIPLIGYSSLTDETILPKEGDSAIGINTATAWAAELDTAANKAYMAAYTKKYNREATRAGEFGYSGAMMLEKALEAVNGDIEDKEAFIKAFENVEVKDAPRGPIKFDKYHNVVMDVRITETRKVDGKLVNSVVDTFNNVSQFWKWTPEEFMKMPAYGAMKGNWVRK